MITVRITSIFYVKSICLGLGLLALMTIHHCKKNLLNATSMLAHVERNSSILYEPSILVANAFNFQTHYEWENKIKSWSRHTCRICQTFTQVSFDFNSYVFYVEILQLYNSYIYYFNKHFQLCTFLVFLY